MNIFSAPVRFGPIAPYMGGGTGIAGIFGGLTPAPHAPVTSTAGIPGASTNVPGLVPGELQRRPGSAYSLANMP